MDGQFKIKNNVLVEYHEQDGVTEVIIPEGVIEIGTGVFYGCTSLMSVTIPESATIIEAYAFEGCENLKTINITESVKYIGIGAFAGCENLISVIIPKGVTKIEYDTFCACTSLISLIIPEGVTTIECYAFCECKNLTEITIPKSVTKMEEDIFFGCNNLKTIIIPSYDIFGMLDYDSKIVALNTIIRDKKQGEYTKEDISKFKGYIVENKMDIFESILKNRNLMDLFYYMLDNNIYTKDELLDLIKIATKNDKINSEISGILLECSNKNKEEKDIETIIDDRFNLDDDIQLKK